MTHVSRVTCHVLRVTCYVLRVTSFVLSLMSYIEDWKWLCEKRRRYSPGT